MKILIATWFVFGLTQSSQETLPVFVDGLPLPEKALIIGGTSYLPVRAVGERLGAKVDYEPSAKRISIARAGIPSEESISLFLLSKGDTTALLLRSHHRFEIINDVIQELEGDTGAGERLLRAMGEWNTSPTSIYTTVICINYLYAAKEAGALPTTISKTSIATVKLESHLGVLIAYHEGQYRPVFRR